LTSQKERRPKMVKTKLDRTKLSNNDYLRELDIYDNYIALDWSQVNMAIAKMTRNSKQTKVIDVPSNIDDLKAYLDNLQGKKILTIEETNTSHWLYVELKEYADRIVICDPYRNRLLSEGPKNDKIDADKLCKLLRNGLLKEVYHSSDNIYELRKLMSAYDDLVKAGVRLQNQKSAIYRSEGKSHKKEEEINNTTTSFILEQINKGIEDYQRKKDEFEKFIKRVNKTEDLINKQMTIPGIGSIGAIKIVSTVIDGHRFGNSGKYLSYCGLVKHKKISGNRNYGNKNPRYSRKQKSVYKTAALAAIGGNNPINDYYEYLITNKSLPEDKARHQISRYIARISYGMLKNGEKYNPYRWRKHKTT